jgi:hypothetical protein
MKCPHPDCPAPSASAPRRDHSDDCPRRASRGGKATKTRVVRLDIRLANIAEQRQHEGRAEEAALALETLSSNKH